MAARQKFIPPLGALIILWLACLSPLPAANKVAIITPHVESIREEFANGFAAWHQKKFGEPAQVEWRVFGGTSDSLRFVQSEFASKPEGIGLDIFFGGGPEPYLVLADKHLLASCELPPEVLAAVPRTAGGVEIYDAAQTWFGPVIASFGILQNVRLQKQLALPFARRWEELADARLVGWVGAGDPRKSGTMNNMYEAILQAYGWERGWQMLHRIGGNVRKFDLVSSSTAKDVTVGETLYAFAIDFYGITQVAAAGRTNLTFKLPEDFTAMSIDGIGVLKGAPNLTTARRFIEFVMGEDGQRLWFLPSGHPDGPKRHSLERMVVRPDLYARYKGVSNIEFSPFDLKQSFRYDANLSRERRDVLSAMFGALIVDTHSELAQAWRAVIRRGINAEDLEELGRVPLTEKEALALARKEWKDATFRNAKKIEWQAWAQKKYRALAERGAPAPREHASMDTQSWSFALR
ncbi:MAG: ABC transporter substrate-binding protein [Verrucomicrobia bacterium]|nr:ABC transporter substrate-binding protein [Verrucomicrobiota bacterium]